METNNAVSITSRGTLNKLRQIKSFIKESYNWNWNVIISEAALHSDNGKDEETALAIHQLCVLLDELDILLTQILLGSI